MKKLLYLLFIFITPLLSYAQNVRVSAPKKVAVGEEFQIEYTVNTENVERLKLGNLPRGLRMIAGPYYTSQKNFQVINGHTSSSSTETFTYLFITTQKGVFTIPSAKVVVKGKTLVSQHVRITSVGNGNIKQNQLNNRNYPQPDVEVRSPEENLPAGKDLIIKVIANKRQIYEQEPVLLTYKVYTNANLVQLSSDMPDIQGCHTQEIKLPQQKTFTTETLGRRKYRCTTWSKYILYPQVTGKIHIPKVNFRGIIRSDIDDFDPFAIMSDEGADIEKMVKSNDLNINVLPLPNKPSNFSGGVGRLNITAQVDKKTVKANTPIKIRVVIGGIGNLKLIKTPTINLDKSFDVYDPNISDKTKLSLNGVEGNMVYDFIAIPRKEGQFTIPPIQLVYFDTATKKYKTLNTSPININVEKGDGVATSSDSSDSLLFNGDIHDLKRADNMTMSTNNFFSSSVYWIIIVVLLLLFIGILYNLRKRAYIRANIAGLRGKNAESIALQRLHKAKVLLDTNQPTDFYDEILKTLLGYASDKLSIEGEVTRDIISQRFKEIGVSDDVLSIFEKAIDECEYERYAPGDEHGNMTTTYNASVKGITSIENSIRENKKMKKQENKCSSSSVMLFMLVIALSFCNLHNVSAINADEAAKAYHSGDYLQAIKSYELLLNKNKTAELYYNLGNSYYRANNIPKAILAYERALKIAPNDVDIRYNLKIAQSKTIDNIEQKSEFFFMIWGRDLVNIFTCNTWAIISIIAMFIALSSIIIYFMASSIKFRKIGFFISLIAIFIFIISTLFAIIQNNKCNDRSGAIVISSIAYLRLTPDPNGHPKLTIHEGTQLTITDKTIKGWYEVELSNGQKGWIAVKSVEVI